MKSNRPHKLPFFLKYLCIGFSLFMCTGLHAQEDETLQIFDYTGKQTYNIGDIKITGAVNRDRNAIKSIAGLRVGNKVTIPGDEIPKAIKALLRLKLFEDVQIIKEKIEGDLIFLEIIIKERPLLTRYSIKGESKSKHSDLTGIIDGILTKGSIVTEDLKELTRMKLVEHYVDKGFMDAEIKISEVKDELKDNSIRLVFDIVKNERVKISDIVLLGNSHFDDRKLKRQLKNTKEIGVIFKKSKYVKSDFEEDKNNLIAFYNKNGFRDAIIVKDSFARRVDGNLQLFLTVEEGDQYFFRNIAWKGNSKYEDEILSRVLGIEAGDIYNPETLEKQLSFSMDGRDVSSLYLDDGYLFFNVDPVETAVTENAIDLEMQIYEGPQATIENVVIKGNDRTHENVVRRELRTKPGNKFSRSDIIRSQRSLMNLGYFNPETMDIQTPVNQQNGTVDIVYDMEERPSDQLELSAGYGGRASGLIGTLGMTFNNFSFANAKDLSKWSPLPQGDGQKVNVRIQSNSRFFRSANLSFTDPWLGGKKPTSFTTGYVWSSFNQSDLGRGSLSIHRPFVGIGTQLKWPDDFFSVNATLSLEFINLNNYDFGRFFVDNVNITTGNFKNFSVNLSLTRSSVADPIFPRRGSRVSFSAQLTPPYSLFREVSTEGISPAEAEELIAEEQFKRGSGAVISAQEQESLIREAGFARRFNLLEYHKYRFNAEWYFNLVDKLVLMTNLKMGFLGSYNYDEIGISPFERFEIGGDGLNNQTVGITGKDILSMRGYQPADFEQNNTGGAAVYDKLTLELRYPLSTNPNSAIYVHSFVQGGNSWSRINEFNPFDLKRSAGFGLRVFLPMFGLLGFDYGWGFDKDPNDPRFEGFGQFNIVLGFEPE